METLAILGVALVTTRAYDAIKDFIAASTNAAGDSTSLPEDDNVLAQDPDEQKALSLFSAFVLPLDIMAAIFIILNAPGFLSLKSFPFVSMTGFTLVAAFMFLTRINLPRDLVGEAGRIHLRKLMLDGILGPCIVVPYALICHRAALSGSPWIYGSILMLYGLQSVGWYRFYFRSLQDSAVRLQARSASRSPGR